MIDDIVEMVLKLTWVLDKENRFSALERILEEINDRVTGILLYEEEQKGRGNYDRRNH